MIITFLISRQKTIPAIRSLVEACAVIYRTHIKRTLLASSKLSEAGPSPLLPYAGTVKRRLIG